MNPWNKEWYDLNKGPMRFRIRARRAKLAKLEEMSPLTDKSKEELLNAENE